MCRRQLPLYANVRDLVELIGAMPAACLMEALRDAPGAMCGWSEMGSLPSLRTINRGRNVLGWPRRDHTGNREIRTSGWVCRKANSYGEGGVPPRWSRRHAHDRQPERASAQKAISEKPRIAWDIPLFVVA